MNRDSRRLESPDTRPSDSSTSSLQVPGVDTSDSSARSETLGLRVREMNKDTANDPFNTASQYFLSQTTLKFSRLRDGNLIDEAPPPEPFLRRDLARDIVTEEALKTLVFEPILQTAAEDVDKYCGKILKDPSENVIRTLEPGLRVILLIILCYGNVDLLVRFEQRFLKTNNTSITDVSLPLTENDAKGEFGEVDGQTFFENQHRFTVATLEENDFSPDIRHQSPMPFLESHEVATSGSTAKVFRVRVESGHVLFNRTVWSRNQQSLPLIAKVFKPDEPSYEDFKKECENLRFIATEQRTGIAPTFCSLVYPVLDEQYPIASIISTPAEDNLWNLMRSNDSPDNPEQCRHYIFQMVKVCEGLVWLREHIDLDTPSQQPIAVTYFHGDVKPQNVLVYRTPGAPSRPEFKIGDFGSAVRLQSRLSEPVPVAERDGRRGTYLAWEAQTRGRAPIHSKSDVWSFGCMMLEVVLYNEQGQSGISSFVRGRETGSPGNHDCFTGEGDWCSQTVTAHIDDLIEISNSNSLPDRYHRLAKGVLEYIKKSMLVKYAQRREFPQVYKDLLAICADNAGVDTKRINRINVPKKALYCGSSPDGNTIFFASTKQIAVFKVNQVEPDFSISRPAGQGSINVTTNRKWDRRLLPTTRLCANRALFTPPGPQDEGVVFNTVVKGNNCHVSLKWPAPDLAIDKAAFSPDAKMFALACRPTKMDLYKTMIRLYRVKEIKSLVSGSKSLHGGSPAEDEDLLREKGELSGVERSVDLFFSRNSESLYHVCKLVDQDPVTVIVSRWNTRTCKRGKTWYLRDRNTTWPDFFVKNFVPLNTQHGFLCIMYDKIIMGTEEGVKDFEVPDLVSNLQTLLVTGDDTRIILLAVLVPPEPEKTKWTWTTLSSMMRTRSPYLHIFGALLGPTQTLNTNRIDILEELSYDPKTDSASLREEGGGTELCITICDERASYLWDV